MDSDDSLRAPLLLEQRLVRLDPNSQFANKPSIPDDEHRGS